MLDKRLINLGRLRARRAVHVCNGDPHPLGRGQDDKDHNATLWQRDQDRTDDKLEALAKELGFTVSYPGLYPVFTRISDGRDFHIGG